MKVLFVSFQENSEVIGLKYLHSFISTKGHDSSILLVPNDKQINIKAAIDHISNLKPNVIGFSAMSYEFGRAKKFAIELKKKYHDCYLVFGGIHATSDPTGCLEICDIIIRGEGEETFLELLQLLKMGKNYRFGDIQGIVFKDDGVIKHTPVRKLIKDLDLLPYIRHLPESMFVTHNGKIEPLKKRSVYKKYARYEGTLLSVVSSRGCPFSCHYCCNSVYKSLYSSDVLRNRKPEKVVDEIYKEIQDFQNILYVNFPDDCFMIHTGDWITTFCDLYSEMIQIPFMVRTTPRHITKEKLISLKKAGLRFVFMGFQTGSDRINKEIYGRNVTSNEYLEKAAWVSELGLCPWYDVILDNPWESKDDQLMTIDILLKTPRPFQLNIFSLDFFPGTQLRQRAIEENIPIPEVGSKSYTKPEPTTINRYIRMSTILYRGMIRLLVRKIDSPFFRSVGLILYPVSIFLELFICLWLIYKSNDYKFYRSLRVVKAFYFNAFKKLILRHQG